MLFLDAPNSHLWDALKSILSHDKYEIEYKTTQTDGSLRVKESIIRGWPAVVFCSARNEAHNRIWEEIETRFDIASPNSEIAKYREANKFTALKMGIPDFATAVVTSEEDEKYARYYVSKIRDRLLGMFKNRDNPIWNPFNQRIADSFPHREGISMRHFNRLMAYINIETLIDYENNYKIMFKTRTETQYSIITSLPNIKSAIDILDTVSVVPPDKLRFLKDVFGRADVNNGVTSSTLAEIYSKVYGKDTTPKKILENYLKPLCDYGILDYSVNPDDRRQCLFKISSEPSINSLHNIRQNIIEESNNDDLFVWKGIIELEKYSIEKGKIEKIINPNGYAEGHNLIQKNIIKSNSKSNILEAVTA